MSDVYLLSSPDDVNASAALEARLRQRGIGVCRGFEQLPEPLRTEALQIIVEAVAAVAVLWSPRSVQMGRSWRTLDLVRSSGVPLLHLEWNCAAPVMAGDTVLRISDWDGEASSPALVQFVDRLAVQVESRSAHAGDLEGAAENFLGAARSGNEARLRDHIDRFPSSPFAWIAAAHLRRTQGRAFRFIPAYSKSIEHWAESEGDPNADAPLRGAAAAEVWRADDAPKSRGVRTFALWSSAGALAAFAFGFFALVPNLQQPREAGPAAPSSAIAGAQPEALVASPEPTIDPELASVDVGVEAFRLELLPEEQAAEFAAPASLAISPDLEGEHFFRARRTNTIAAYDVFLASYPSGPRADEIRALRARLARAPDAFNEAALDEDARTWVIAARRLEARANSAAIEARAQQRRSGFTAALAILGGAYDGTTRSGRAEGVGRILWPNRDYYAGEWSRSLPHGSGVYRFADGRRYEGEFRDGAPTGNGAFWDREGRRLVGARLFTALVDGASANLASN